MRPGRRAFLAAVALAPGCIPVPAAPPTAVPATPSTPAAASATRAPVGAGPSPWLLAVTNSSADAVTLVDPTTGPVASIRAGFAPWGLARTPDGRLFASTAEGVAVLDTAARTRLALVPHRARVQVGATGEFRPGGMGIAASPDGRRVYVGVYTPGGSTLEVLDTASLQIIASVPLGVRPFDVLADARAAYSLDHDSYSVTVVDAATLAPRRIEVAPLGRGAYDKPHFGAIHGGALLLPIQGRTLVRLDPATGAMTQSRLRANTHQHGVAISPDGTRMAIIGTGPAGSADGPPSLSLVDLRTLEDEVIPLAKLHERVAFSPDGGTAYLTGGYTLGGAWDGISALDLRTRQIREIAVPNRPMDVLLIPASTRPS